MFNKNKGFTLVEVMIVVGIIAILAGIFLVGSGQFRASANAARIKADLQKLEALQEVYYSGHGNYAGDIDDLSSSLPSSPVTGVSYTSDETQSCATGLPENLNILDDDTSLGNTAGDNQYCLTR